MENLKSEIFRDSTMNRAERRRAAKLARKSGQVPPPNTTKDTQVEIELIQPWSNFLMKTKLPDEVLDKMLDLTDEVLQDPDRYNWGDNLAGQIQDEPLIPHDKLQQAGVYQFFLNMIGEYVKLAMRQQATSYDYDTIANEQWLTQMKSCWIISQWTGEYNPIHVHTECAMSTVMYLKVPEFLPSTKPKRDDDGNTMFIGAGGTNSRFTRNLLKVKPKVGDFFLFPAHLQHCVYPFKTDGDCERRSVSFNADFIAKTEYDKREEEQKKMQQQQQQTQPPQQNLQRAPETLTIDTEK